MLYNIYNSNIKVGYSQGVDPTEDQYGSGSDCWKKSDISTFSDKNCFNNSCLYTIYITSFAPSSQII